MKNSASKPHFFKLILPGFENGLKIPKYFSKFILCTEKGYPDEALLKKKGREWRVNVTNEYFVGDGWTRFAEENILEPGDFVVFKHRGNMVFEVIIYDGITQCRKEQLTQPERRPLKKPRFEPANPKDVQKETLTGHEVEEEVAEVSLASPHFIGTIKPYNIAWHYLDVPREFARSNGLMGRNCKIIVKDEQERSWDFELSTVNDRDAVRIRGRSLLAKLFRANGLKEGDSYKLEVEVAGLREETPVVRILPLIVTTKKKVSNQGKGNIVEVIDISESESESENDGRPYFNSTIKPYCLKSTFLHIPMKFARSNGLCEKRKMILEDKMRRTWQVNLAFYGSHLNIQGSGWKKIVDENGIKEGDVFKFEIVKNGAVPAVRFTVIDGFLKR